MSRHDENRPRWSRRGFLQGSAIALAGCSVAPDASVAADAFVHRGYNGWITDLAADPDPRAAWPSMRLDEKLLRDYAETFALMRRIGFNEIVIWGLYVANDWPLDLPTAVPPERGRLVERLVASAHENGIQVLSGLGTYSWGFAKIIRANPKLNGGNSNAMCASEPESHEWMRRIVDFVFTRFPIDGVSMQSADQGRCKCARCAKTPDLEYHAELLARTADYIRTKWPGKVVGMSNWGVGFGNPRDQDALVRLSRSLDYLCDYNDSASRGGKDYRRTLTAALACPLGTTGGLVVEPPQHWARERWFLPTCGRVHRHLRALHADGGRACEFFFHILANPSSEMTFHVAGRALARPQEPLERLMGEAIDELYGPRSPDARAMLGKLFVDAEDAYFEHAPGDRCGTLSLEPLSGDKPGPPIYLRNNFPAAAREVYARKLRRIRADFEALRPELSRADRLDRCVRCIDGVLADLA